jgi:hypothetical protein
MTDTISGVVATDDLLTRVRRLKQAALDVVLRSDDRDLSKNEQNEIDALYRAAQDIQV